MNARMPWYDRVTCADGTSLSVQASRCMYATPRNDVGPYTHVEVGFPSVPPPETWREFCDSGPVDDPTSFVYGYVPVHLVRAFIAAHGGMRTGTLPPMVED